MTGKSVTGTPGAAAPRDPLARERYLQAGGENDANVLALVDRLARFAPATFQLAAAKPERLNEALREPLHQDTTLDHHRRAFTARLELQDGGVADQGKFLRGLREVRHGGLIRVALRDLLGLADIDQTSREISHLAEAAVEAAWVEAQGHRVARDRRPERGDRPVPFVVLGMGKLAGCELNFGSDVDLCFFCGESGEGTGAAPWFSAVAERICRSLDAVTDDGFVFRVDLRLRPEGQAGPLVTTLDFAERYYPDHGRPWERAVLLRARPVAGDRDAGHLWLRTARPFVFPARVDPQVVEELRSILIQTRQHVGDAVDRDVKLGEGGIREAELVVQTLQLVWGGKHPELRVSNTVRGARRLVGLGFLSPEEGTGLEADWAFLRAVEHRIHMASGVQTHRLPEGEALGRLAEGMGFSNTDAFLSRMERTRDRVHDLFESLRPGGARTGSPSPGLSARIMSTSCSDGVLHGTLGVTDVEQARSHLRRLSRGRYPLLREAGSAIGDRFVAEVSSVVNPDAALRLSADFFGRLGGQWGYMDLFERDPRFLRRLVALFGSCEALSQVLLRRPELLDDALTGGLPATVAEIGEEHDRRAPWQSEDPFDETMAESLRALKSECELSTGLDYVNDEASLGEVTRRLTALAEAQVSAAHHMAGGAATGGAVVALGKLGSRELGFGSDLDLLFVHGDGEAGHACVRAAQRTLRTLSTALRTGDGYEVDTRLRPDGTQGMLSVHLDAWGRYLRERAGQWELLAATRARWVAGATAFQGPVVDTLQAQLWERDVPGDEIRLQAASMRARLQRDLGRERRDRYHPKVGFGALVDVEFIAQVLQRLHGGHEPTLRHGSTRDTLERARALGIIRRDDALALLQAHELFRRVEMARFLLHPRGEPWLHPGGRSWSQVARWLGQRAIQEGDAGQMLVSRWQRETVRVRAIFERLVAPVGEGPVWTP